MSSPNSNLELTKGRKIPIEDLLDIGKTALNSKNGPAQSSGKSGPPLNKQLKPVKSDSSDTNSRSKGRNGQSHKDGKFLRLLKTIYELLVEFRNSCQDFELSDDEDEDERLRRQRQSQIQSQRMQIPREGTMLRDVLTLLALSLILANFALLCYLAPDLKKWAVSITPQWFSVL